MAVKPSAAVRPVDEQFPADAGEGPTLEFIEKARTFDMVAGSRAQGCKDLVEGEIDIDTGTEAADDQAWSGSTALGSRADSAAYSSGQETGCGPCAHAAPVMTVEIGWDLRTAGLTRAGDDAETGTSRL